MSESLLEKLYSPNHFREFGVTVLDQIAHHLEVAIYKEDKKTIQWNDPSQELKFWENFYKKGKKEDLVAEILGRTTHIHNPKYLGHQVAATAPITLLTGMLSALLNNGMAVYEMGMSPSSIEKIVTDRICKKIGYGQDAAGFLTSGGTLANLTALLSARKAIVDYDVWNDGLDTPLGIMVCEEAHYCVDRAAKIMGLGEKGIIKIPAMGTYSMDVSQLEKYYNEATSKGIKVFAIIGSAPSTATGAYDNLKAIAQFAQEKQIWFHVDGAHGGAAIYSEKYSHLLQGIEQADSVVIDGHKMMLMPAITTALLFKNTWHSQHTFSQKADYLLNDEEEEHWINSGKKTFECTKTMMCLNWFVLIKCYGERIFDEFVTRQYDLARTFEELLISDPNFEIATSPQSNIVCFRWFEARKTPSELNLKNAKIRQVLLEDGEYYIVQTRLRGIHYLRTTLMNAFTTEDHLIKLLGKIKSVATTAV
ncbi:MAG: aminotransferase class I/II-fold pyridoxal phosphate-dependent enzyme [Bacteroidota bacterium]